MEQQGVFLMDSPRRLMVQWGRYGARSKLFRLPGHQWQELPSTSASACALSLICEFLLIPAVLILGFLVIPFALTGKLRRHRPGQRYDVIIVLGCRVEADGRPGRLLKARVEEGVALFREGAAPRVLVTGSAVYNKHLEAESMAAYAEECGIPCDVIVKETKARDTRENALHSAAIMRERGWRTAVVVTTGSHVRRSAFLFREAGIACRVAGARIPRGFPPWRRLRLWFIEWYLLNRYGLRKVTRISRP